MIVVNIVIFVILFLISYPLCLIIGSVAIEYITGESHGVQQNTFGKISAYLIGLFIMVTIIGAMSKGCSGIDIDSNPSFR